MADIIQLLPDHVANQIAAGEVVQRPSSVVKELLENAVDAEATSIKLIVKDAGKTLIQVIDNGNGMSVTDARLSFERHATSKIRNAEDLFNIHTKGFRGEALASIAAISHVELKTRQAHDDIGVQIKIEGSTVKSQEVIVVPKGTSVAVKNLFFNIPARRNFLKSNPVETRHIIDEFHRISLAHPDINFVMIHNGSEIFNLPVSKIRQRIVNIFGGKTNEKLVPVKEETDVLKISGHVWDIEKRRHLFETRAPGSTPILTLDYSPDGSKVATAGVSTAVQIWDVTQEPPKVVQTLDAGRDSRPIRCLAFSPDGTLLASGGNDSTVRIWDLNAGTLLATLEGHKRPATSVRFAPDSRSLVSAGLDKTVRLWEIDRPSVSTIADPENYFVALRFSPDGEAVLTGSRGGMQLIDRRTRSVRRSFPVQEQRVISVAYAPDGKWVAGMAVERNVARVYLWDAESEEPSASFEGNLRVNVGMDFSPDSRLFAVPLGTQIRLWSVEENRELPRIVRPVDSWSVAFGPDNLLVSGESDGSVTAIYVESREPLFRIRASDRQLTRVAVSGDGRLVAAGGIDGVVRVFELASRNLLHEFREHSGFVCVDFSPDASFLASVGTGDQTLRLWDMEEGQEQAVFKGQSSEDFFDVDFSSDGSLVGTNDFGSQIHIWDARSRVGDVSRFADYLKHLEIQGRHVESRTVDNLYEEEGIPLRPVSQGTHIALLRRGGTDEEIQRALFWHLLRAQNLRGAAHILRHLSAEETPSERDAVEEECAVRGGVPLKLGAQSRCIAFELLEASLADAGATVEHEVARRSITPSPAASSTESRLRRTGEVAAVHRNDVRGPTRHATTRADSFAITERHRPHVENAELHLHRLT